MGMSIDEAITKYKNNAEYERTHGNLQGCLEFRQLAEWLRKYQKITAVVKAWDDDENAMILAILPATSRFKKTTEVSPNEMQTV